MSVEPFTLEHFRRWSSALVLDSGNKLVLEPFQEAVAVDLFSGITEVWDVVPEGNGKTTLIAALALYHCEHVPSAEVPVAASSRDQAEILYRQAAGFVRRTPELQLRYRAYDGYRRIVSHESGGRIQVFAADDRTGDGVIFTLGVLDELHRHRDLKLYRTWTGKTDKRQGQILVISTAGEPGSEFEEVRERKRQEAVEIEREGFHIRAADEDEVLHDWSVPEDADVEDLAVVKAANPFSGVTLETLRKKRARKGMTIGHWRRFTCNLPTRSENAAITEVEWFGAEVDDDIPDGERVWLGIDLGWKHDTTALQPLWIRDSEYRLLGHGKTLIPPRDGQSLHPDEVKAALVEIHERTPIHTAVMDTSNGEDIASWIETDLGVPVVDRGQTNAYACVDYDKFMEALRQGWLKHSGDPSLSRHALNAIARQATFGDLRFDRPSLSRSDALKQNLRVIDRLTAAAMAHTSAAVELDVGDMPLAVMV